MSSLRTLFRRRSLGHNKQLVPTTMGIKIRFFSSAFRGFVLALSVVVPFEVTSAQSRVEPAYNLGIIGDSISVGFNASAFGVNRELSWTGGLDPQGRVLSHALRLQALLQRPVIVHNEAFAGAETKNLVKQTDRLLSSKIDYVSIMIGANDLCKNAGAVEWQSVRRIQDVQDSITRIIEANPEVKIVLAAIPDMLRLRETGLGRGCQATWNIAKICSPLLGRDRTDAERSLFGERLNQMNHSLSEMAMNFSEHVRFDWATSEFEFPWEYISRIDCFHPSVPGQNKISEITFDPNWK